MRPRPMRVAALAAAALAAASLAACGSSKTTPSAGTPVTGGTLRWVAQSGPDHYDPASAYYDVDYMLERSYARQLVTYPSNNDYSKTIQIIPDAATQVPSTSNGGISSDGLTYTFHIRSGVMWNTSPSRQVTAQDFVREIKRLCNPVNPAGGIGYYTSTIVGMKAYCAAYANVPSTASAATLANFQNSHNVSGLSAPDNLTLVIHLNQRASDFLNIMAMPFASAAPVEWDSYVPDSATFQQHVFSNGPYAITAIVPSKSIVMDKNPAWKQSSDPVRHQYVAKQVVTMGVSSPETALSDMQAGTQDLSLDLPPATSAFPSLQGNPNFYVSKAPITNPYVVFNMQSPDANRAVTKPLVRQAIEYAVNKVAISKIYGGTAMNPIINTAIPPGSVGYQPFNLYPTPNNQGDPAKCKSMLTQAGYPNGLTIVDAYRNAGNHPDVYQAVKAALALCGITVKGNPQQQANYYTYIQNGPLNKQANRWDISEPGWIPDWYGNNGRATVQPLFGTNCLPNTANAGCYTSTAVDSLISQALTATNQSAAASLWHQADMQVMKDAAIVPIMNNATPLYHSNRVKNATFSSFLQQFDPTLVWLSPNTP